MTQKEEIEKELVERIYKKLVHAMFGANGEYGSGLSEDFLNGLITAYRIVESFDPKPEPKTANEIIKKLMKR